MRRAVGALAAVCAAGFLAPALLLAQERAKLVEEHLRKRPLAAEPFDADEPFQNRACLLHEAKVATDLSRRADGSAPNRCQTAVRSRCRGSSPRSCRSRFRRSSPRSPDRRVATTRRRMASAAA